MAMVLDALAAYIQNKLMEIMEEKVHMLLGVPSEIERMKVKLADLKRFLADADRRNITDKTVQEWVKEFKGAMYDATDILDLCQLKDMEQGPIRDMGCFSPLLSCVRNPVHSYKISARLKALNEKIEDISKRRTAFNLQELTSYDDQGRKKESLRLANHETTGELDKLALVGEKIEDDTRKLVELLTREEAVESKHNNIKIFAILGSGGIGKTTLAQNIFNNEIIQQKFDKIIWLSVNQNFDEHDLLEKTITEAGGNHNAARNTNAALERSLKEALKEKKTMLVMDDVWDHKAWDTVLKSPLKNVLAQGSRVLITTRHAKVARGMMADEPYHNVDKLKQEDAWSLLKKQVVTNETDEYQAEILLKDIGMGIVARCDGLPLAIKAMGGLLRQKKIKRSDWESVLQDPIWSEESQMAEDLNNAINLSYQNLPSYLKPCFLHFSLLPKSIVFHVGEIVGMWISEGFVHDNSRDLELLGREYYDELILRNLIEPDISFVNCAVCNMHDVVRSFAHYVARDEALCGNSNLMDIIGKLSSQQSIRRISIETKGSDSEKLEWMALKAHISLRTLISVGPIKIKPHDSWVTFPGLRSLHVQNTKFDALAGSLVHLKHLRYLSIEKTDTTMLPENIGDKMKFLQHISVSNCKRLVKLPSSIGKLQYLRTLDLRGSNINNVPKGFSGPTNLRKLYGFPAHMDGDWCSLEALGPLSKLIELSINGLENISSSLFVTKARLCEKVRLSYLSLNWTRKDGDDSNLAKQQQMEELFDKLCPLPCLEELYIEGYSGSRLPRWMMTASAASLGSLRILMMEDLPYCIELPDSLYQLPYLEVLKIENAPLIKSIGPEFLQPHNYEYLSSTLGNLYSVVNVLVIQCHGLMRIINLPKTEELTIIWCPNLKVLEGMPALQRINLDDYEMKTLPRYIRNVNPKQLLQIDCHASLLGSIAIGKSGPEWDKFCHVRQVKVYAHDDDNDIERKWYVKYTRDPFSFETNASRSQIAQARMEHKQRLWLAYEITCPVDEKRAVGHADADEHQPLCHRFRNNAYRRLSCWLRWEACLHCCETDDIADPSDQWTEAADYPACTACTPQEVQEDSASDSESSSESATTETSTETSDSENVGEQRNDDKLLSFLNCCRCLVKK